MDRMLTAMLNWMDSNLVLLITLLLMCSVVLLVIEQLGWFV